MTEAELTKFCTDNFKDFRSKSKPTQTKFPQTFPPRGRAYGKSGSFLAVTAYNGRVLERIYDKDGNRIKTVGKTLEIKQPTHRKFYTRRDSSLRYRETAVEIVGIEGYKGKRDASGRK